MNQTTKRAALAAAAAIAMSGCTFPGGAGVGPWGSAFTPGSGLASSAPAPASDVQEPPNWDGTWKGCQSLYGDEPCDRLWDLKVNGSVIAEDGSHVRFHVTDPDYVILKGCVSGMGCGDEQWLNSPYAPDVPCAIDPYPQTDTAEACPYDS